MPNYDSKEEEQLTDCLQIIAKNPRIKLARLARELRVLYDKLRRRIRHVADGRLNGGHNKRLTAMQEDGFKRYITYLINIGEPPDLKGLWLAANKILIQCGNSGSGVSGNWAKCWLARNSDWFKNIYARTIVAKRKAVYDQEDIAQHFADFQFAMSKYGVVQSDV